MSCQTPALLSYLHKKGHCSFLRLGLGYTAQGVLCCGCDPGEFSKHGCVWSKLLTTQCGQGVLLTLGWALDCDVKYMCWRVWDLHLYYIWDLSIGHIYWTSMSNKYVKWIKFGNSITLNSTYNEVAFDEKLKENVCTKYTTNTYKYVALNEKLPITKQNLSIFFFIIGRVECISIYMWPRTLFLIRISNRQYIQWN